MTNTPEWAAFAQVFNDKEGIDPNPRCPKTRQLFYCHAAGAAIQATTSDAARAELTHWLSK